MTCYFGSGIIVWTGDCIFFYGERVGVIEPYYEKGGMGFDGWPEMLEGWGSYG